MEDTDKASEEYGYAAYNVTTVKPTTEHPFLWKIDPDDLERIGGMDALRDSVLNQMSVTYMAAKLIAECGTDTAAATAALNPTKQFCRQNFLDPLIGYPRIWNGAEVSMGALYVLDDIDVAIPPFQEVTNDDGSHAVVYPGYCRAVTSKASAPFVKLFSEIEDYLIRVSAAHPEAKREISDTMFALGDLVSALKASPDNRDGDISNAIESLELALRKAVSAIGHGMILPAVGDPMSAIGPSHRNKPRKPTHKKLQVKHQANKKVNPKALTQEKMASLITNCVYTAHQINLPSERKLGMTPRRLTTICGIMSRDHLAYLEGFYFDENHRMPNYYYHTKLRLDASFINERNEFLKRWRVVHEDIIAHFLKWREENPHALVKEFKYNYYKAHNGQVKNMDSYADSRRLCGRESDQKALDANRARDLSDKRNGRNSDEDDELSTRYDLSAYEQDADES